MKKQIFASALKRVNREIGRMEEAERRPTLAESARRALELKRADRVRHRPSAGRAPSQGMRSLPNGGDTARVDPREVGRVSQAVTAAQARRDRRSCRVNVLTRRPPAAEPPTRGIPSNVAILGHPIHPMLIPYPVAFLTSVVATDLAARATKDSF